MTIYNIKETAAILRCNVCTVRREINKGYMPCRTIGNRLFFTPADIDQYLEIKAKPAFKASAPRRE